MMTAVQTNINMALQPWVMTAPILLSSITNKMQRYTILFIAVNALHVSGSFYAYHKELKNCTHSIWYMSRLLGSPTTLAVATRKLDIYQILCVQFLSS
jgi:hypothetical protein